MKKFAAFALLALCLSVGIAEARLGDRIRARRASNTCTTCTTQAAAVPAAKEPVKAAPVAAPAASNCPGGVCPAPSARRDVFGLRR